MKKIVLLFSHTLTDIQIEELEKDWNCKEIIYLPDDLRNNWMNVDGDFEAQQFENFLLETLRKDDYVLVQGEWGLTYHMINFAKKNNFIPLYAGSTRNSIEYRDGDKVIKKSVFSHTGFKKY